MAESDGDCLMRAWFCDQIELTFEADASPPDGAEVDRLGKASSKEGGSFAETMAAAAAVAATSCV